MSSKMITMIHESRLPTLETKFKNINKKLKGHGQIGYKITGAQFAPYTDSNGVKHDDGLYFNVETQGAARFSNMEYIGKIDILDGKENLIRPYGKITEDEYNQLASFHGTECACCNVSRKRNDLYAFRCTETSVNPETGVTYEAGKIYPVGSSCIDKFTGLHAKEIIDQMSGEIDLSQKESASRDSKPTYIDAKKFMMYALQVGNTRLDEAFSFYKRHPSVKQDSPEDVYDKVMSSPKTYRIMSGKDDKAKGNITATALAAYRLCEDGYVDNSFFKNDDYVNMFKSLMKVCDFNDGLPMMAKASDKIKSIYAKNIESDDMYIKLLGHNAQALCNTEYLHESHAQKLVDVCDAYFLSHNSCAMHESEKPLYDVVDNYNTVKGKFTIGKTDSGAPVQTNVTIKSGRCYNHQLNGKELTKLFNGYPLILEDCTNRGESFKMVVSIQPSRYSNDYVLMHDNRFQHDGHIDRNAVKHYKPPFAPTNPRIDSIITTPEKPSVAVNMTQKLDGTMKTGEEGNRYKTKEIALKQFNYYKNSNLVKGAGQFTIETDSAALNAKMREKSMEIADYVDEITGSEEYTGVADRIHISSNRCGTDSKYSFTLAYSDFAEDKEHALECQKAIVDTIQDMFPNDMFTVSKARPISDVELVSITEAQCKLKSMAVHDNFGSNGGHNGNTSLAAAIPLNESYAPKNDNDNNKINMPNF